MSIANLKKIHFIGIGGIGVSAIARMMLKKGKEVSGSDYTASELIQQLEQLGARVYIGHDGNNLNSDTDLVIYSAAIEPENPERIRATELEIQQLSYGEFLGKYSRNKKTIAIAGTNGKTTTTAILGQVLVDCGLDPTVVVGSQLKLFGGNYREGNSEYFVLEADEYKANMLNVEPWTIMLTSIEEDHLDFYHNLDDIINHFQMFVEKQPVNGYIFYNADDPNIKRLEFRHHFFGCSITGRSDYWIKNYSLSLGNARFSVYFRNDFLEEFCLRIPGDYNVLNSLMVIGLCHQLMVDMKKVKESLENFNGLWRRFELVGTYQKAEDVQVISDYTHHPDAIKKTLKAARSFYPNRRLFLVYQPHQHHRTKALFDQFVTCFGEADFLILSEIYDVAGRKSTADSDVSSKDLMKAIIKKCLKPKNKIYFAKDLRKTKKLIAKYIKPGDLLIIMGAGDIDKVAREII